MEAWRDELYHHGIDGQRWGIRNGPPYPLSPSKSRAVKRKAASSMSDSELRSAINRKKLENRYTSLASKMGKYGAANAGINIARKSINLAGNTASAASSAYRLKGWDKAAAIDNSDLTDKQKKAAKKELLDYKNEKKASIASQTTKLASIASKNAQVKPNTDFSQLSDDDLKKAIDRMASELEYNDLYGINKGREYTERVISIAGDAVALASTALTIALLIKEFKKVS